MPQPVVLSLKQTRTAFNTRRTITVQNLAGRHGPACEIFYDMVDDTIAPEPDLLDGFVYAVIFYAMRLGQDIRVEGRMSRECLRNLSEFQNAWVSWKPDIYRKINVVPDETVDRMITEGDAVAAFSGGVDSIFTALRHANGRSGFDAYPLTTVVLIHGFDVPLDKPQHLEALKERMQPLIDELGLQLRIIATNSRELPLQIWKDSHGAQLAACLHNYSHEFAYGLVGSSEPYNALVLPWGSTPATDFLLSGGALRIVHDGAGYSRIQKVEELVKYPTAVKVAKVCWEGEQTYKNCGRCGKCVRALLSFKAAGVSNPACFDGPLDNKRISSMNLLNDSQCTELKSILAYTAAKGLRGDWVDELKARVRRYDTTQRGITSWRASLKKFRKRIGWTSWKTVRQ